MLTNLLAAASDNAPMTTNDLIMGIATLVFCAFVCWLFLR